MFQSVQWFVAHRKWICTLSDVRLSGPTTLKKFRPYFSAEYVFPSLSLRKSNSLVYSARPDEDETIPATGILWLYSAKTATAKSKRVLYLDFFYCLWCTVYSPDNQYISATDYSTCSGKTQNRDTYCAPPPPPTAVGVGLLTVEASRSH
jgi:hypothetical protein